ncbi:putative tubby-like domain-containing protein [Medicago truncatula]|uniref:LURP-one-like protein n=1 Tax=Medicago truncatula TaxID=3880 RepID=G7KW21_MEDTR|nr:protein LURP-one-related 10 isoform X2 [Medicago truncatula]AES79757.1 LURP-one-like protein [Medicago truncatula]RHN46634.1 putative tubby-like domain-containing protein [Medicago truncatula]
MAYPYQPQPSASAPPMPVLPTTIFGPQYCAPYPLDLAVVKKVIAISDGNFVVTDVNGNIVFKVKVSLLTFRDRRVLVDAADNPITTLRRKIVTMHDRWEAYRGESTDSKDLIFTLKRSSLIQMKTKLDVFLANNTKEDVCDFKVKGSWFERSCIVYAGESNNIVAQMHKKHTVQSLLIGKDHFMVTIYPNVDYAFIVALIVILNEINADEKGSESGLLDEVLLGGV